MWHKIEKLSKAKTKSISNPIANSTCINLVSHTETQCNRYHIGLLILLVWVPFYLDSSDIMHILMLLLLFMEL